MLATYLTAIFTLLTTVILALIGWGMKSEIRSLRSEFRESLASAELRFFERVNGSYVRREMLDLKLAALRCSECSEPPVHHR